MKSEIHLEQPVRPDEEVIQEDVQAPPPVRRLPYKTVLVAVVVGIITISGVWLFVIDEEKTLSSAVTELEPDIQTHEFTEAIRTRVARTEDKYDQVDRRLASLSGRIDRGFETQKSHSTSVKDGLAALANSVQTVKVAVTDLVKSNKELSQRLDEAISRLDILRKRKVAQRKPTAKPQPAKTPPFHIDAIDVWDGVTYVAISQSGGVAFLKLGEQQSGWTATYIDRLKGQVKFQGPAGQVHSASIQR